MTHHFKYFNFTHGCFFGLFLFVRVLELFNGYKIFLFHISALQYDTICSLTDGRENLVFLHYILFLLIFNNIFLCNIINLLIRRKQNALGKYQRTFCFNLKPDWIRKYRKYKILSTNNFISKCQSWTESNKIIWS